MTMEIPATSGFSLPPQSESITQTAKSTQQIRTPKESTLSRAVNSIGVGLLGYATSIPALGCLQFLKQELIGPRYDPYALQNVLVGSILVGAGLAVRNFRKVTPAPTPATPSPSLPPALSLSPAPTDVMVSKIFKATCAGLQTSAATFGAVLTGVLIAENMGFRLSRLTDGFLLRTIAFMGISRFVKTYSAANQPSSSLPSKTENIALVQESPQIQTETAKESTVARAVKSLGVGFVGYAAALPTLLYLMNRASTGYNQDALPLALGGSVLIGSALAVKNFRKVTPLNTLPNNTPAVPTENTLAKTYRSVNAGMHATAATFGTLLTGMLLAESQGAHFVHGTEGTFLRFSAIVGTAIFAKTFFNVSLSALPKRLYDMSRIKKVGIVAAALAAGTTAYLGPRGTAKQIGGMVKFGEQTIYDIGGFANKQFENLVFTRKTETTTKTYDEWHKSYSDVDEATRLAGLSSEFEEVTCAEILWTCDLHKNDPGHKKAFQRKMLKFSPDKFADKELARKASPILNKANELMKANKECSGQDDGWCAEKNTKRTVHKTLQTPNWLYAKLKGIDPVCYITSEEGELTPVGLDVCSNLM